MVTAVYCLYSEGYDSHTNCKRSIAGYRHDWEKRGENLVHTVTTQVEWDEEGRYSHITLVRRCMDWKAPVPDGCDPITVELKYRGRSFQYTVEARQLCYAIAKAATQALKKYGFWGYHSSSGSGECFGDSINVEQLLFIKAYALNVLKVRELKPVWRNPRNWMGADGSSFEEELELLLFDM